MRRIVAIVEGHGEVEAVPILLRRIAERVLPETTMDAPRPIRVARNRILRQREVERAVELAARKTGPDGGVLILMDANGDCPAEVAGRVLERALETRRDRSIRVVLAKMEYEAWFLAAAASLAGKQGMDMSVTGPPDPESIRDAKGWLTSKMPRGQSYRETLHQAALTTAFDLDAARASPSFDKLWRDVCSLLGLPGAA